MKLAAEVILGEVDSRDELDKAIPFLKGLGLVVFPHIVDNSATEIAPGKGIKQDSKTHFLVACYENDFELYSKVFKRCSAGYNHGEDRIIMGKRRVGPALWDLLTLPKPPADGDQVFALRSALSFYADEGNYDDTIITKYDYNDGFHSKTSRIMQDRGSKARALLR